MHWWVLPAGPGRDVSSRTASGGSLAVLLPERAPRLAHEQPGEPVLRPPGRPVRQEPDRVHPRAARRRRSASDFARAHVLVGGTPVFESDAWLVWADQFREQHAGRDQGDDGRGAGAAPGGGSRPRAADPRPTQGRDAAACARRRARRDDDGDTRARGPDGRRRRATGRGPSSTCRSARGRGARSRRHPRGIGAVLTQVDDEDGDPATEVFSMLSLDPKWVTEEEAESVAIVNGNAQGPARPRGRASRARTARPPTSCC